MEKLCQYYREDHGLETRVVRFHNVYGPLGTYEGGKEKAPAAISRKVALIPDGEEIEISHMCHIQPDLIHLDQAKDNPHGETPLYHLDPQDPRDTLCYVPATREGLQQVFDQTGDTITGRPSRASAKKGKAYHEHLVGRLVEVLESMQATSSP